MNRGRVAYVPLPMTEERRERAVQILERIVADYKERRGLATDREAIEEILVDLEKIYPGVRGGQTGV